MPLSAPVLGSQPPLLPGQRGSARARLNLPARLVTFNGASDCTLVDMSRSGAKIRAADCPRIGAMVVVEGLPQELFGTVRWRGTTIFGFEFERAYSTEQVAAMRRYADGEGDRQRCAEVDYARDWVAGTI